jgi:hypothetical protein
VMRSVRFSPLPPMHRRVRPAGPGSLRAV